MLPSTGLSKRNGAKLRDSFCPPAASHSRPRRAGAWQNNPFLLAAKPRRSINGVWPSSSYNIFEIVAIRGQKSMVTHIIEVTELNFEVRCDLRGSLEAAIASEAVGGNIHIDTRVIKVAEVI